MDSGGGEEGGEGGCGGGRWRRPVRKVVWVGEELMVLGRGRCTIVGVRILGCLEVLSSGLWAEDVATIGTRSTGCRGLDCLHRLVGLVGRAVEQDVTVFAG